MKYFWDNHLERHFEEEETLLFSSFQDSLSQQAIAEHKHIRNFFETIIHLEPILPNQLNLLADTLDDHIGFEERCLFPHLEKELPEATLTEIRISLQQSHQTYEKDDYPYEFWT